LPAIGFDLDTARLAAAFCVCLGLALCATDVAAGQASAGLPAARRPRAAGGLIGLAIWADPLMAGWPAPLALWTAALPLAVGIGVWGLSAFNRAEGLQGVIGGGAILGGGLAASHGAALALIGGPADTVFDDAPFTAGIGVSTALAVLALWLWRRTPQGPARIVAALAIAVAATVSRTLARIAGGLDVPGACAGCHWAVAISGAILLGALWALYRLELRPVTARRGAAAS
jgi:NO-binding membrane sensor protein with MHYT domain